jgi:hypothetical protein
LNDVKTRRKVEDRLYFRDEAEGTPICGSIILSGALFWVNRPLSARGELFLRWNQNRGEGGEVM